MLILEPVLRKYDGGGGVREKMGPLVILEMNLWFFKKWKIF